MNPDCDIDAHPQQNQTIMNLRIKLLPHAHRKLAAMTARDLPRLESLFNQVTRKNQEYGQLVRALTAMYGLLNRLLAVTCVDMKYSLRQWEWPDNEPLTMLVKAMPELVSETSQWYQRNLSLVMMSPLEANHPWWSLEIHDLNQPVKQD